MKKIAMICAALMSCGLTWADAPTAVVDAAKVAAIATPAVTAEQKNDNTHLVSPRTGLRYVVTNPGNRGIIFQTEAMAAVNAQNVTRIVATNPALSPESQKMAMANLLQLAGLTNAPTTNATPAAGQPSVVLPIPAVTPAPNS